MNKRVSSYLWLCMLLWVFQQSQAQVNVTTLGIQLKPMIPSKYLGTGTEDAEVEGLQVHFEPNVGLNF